MFTGTPFFVGFGGPSCSGKSVLAHGVAERLAAGGRASVVLPMDAYYADLSHLPLEERARCNFDDPQALDWALLADHLDALARGESIERPCYDFATHTRQARSHRVAPEPFVLIEGLLALHAETVRARVGLGVYVHAEDSVCLARRVERDTRDRGRTPESVVRQYGLSVRPMAERYVWPSRATADIVVDTTYAPLGCGVDEVVGALRGLSLA